jgi:hypothetical protein
VWLLASCSSAHEPEAFDAGVDAARAIDAGRDSSFDGGLVDAAFDSALPPNYCALADIRYPDDGTPQPTCEALGESCGDATNLPDEQGTCQLGLCCAGVVFPSTCECTCGLGPPCRGAGKRCCQTAPGLVPRCLDAAECMP